MIPSIESSNSAGLPSSSVSSTSRAFWIAARLISSVGSSTSRESIQAFTSLASLKTLLSLSTRLPFASTV